MNRDIHTRSNADGCLFFVVSISEEQCHPSPCGQNTKCEVVSGTPTCSCLRGYTGSPLSGCRHECETDGECGGQEMCKDFKCASSCSQCGQGAVCSRVTNHRAVCECPKVKLMIEIFKRRECLNNR